MSVNRRTFLALAGSTLVVAACGSPQTQATAPRFFVQPTEIDFGNVSYGRPVRASFRVTNVGGAPLILSVPSTARLEEGC